MSQHLSTVKALIAANADVDAKRGDGLTALMSAFQNGHLGAVQALLATKAPVNAKVPIAFTALHMASLLMEADVEGMIGAGRRRMGEIRPLRDDPEDFVVLTQPAEYSELMPAPSCADCGGCSDRNGCGDGFGARGECGGGADRRIGDDRHPLCKA